MATGTCQNLQGFRATLDAIVQNLPRERQTMLFSATQTKSVRTTADWTPCYLLSGDLQHLYGRMPAIGCVQFTCSILIDFVCATLCC